MGDQVTCNVAYEVGSILCMCGILSRLARIFHGLRRIVGTPVYDPHGCPAFCEHAADEVTH